jgi:hypothetical protein
LRGCAGASFRRLTDESTCPSVCQTARGTTFHQPLRHPRP